MKTLYSTKLFAFITVVGCSTYLAANATLTSEYTTLIGTLCGAFFGYQIGRSVNGNGPTPPPVTP